MKGSKIIAVLLAIVLLLGAGYAFLNISFENNREEVLDCIDRGQFQMAREAMGNVMFFRYKDEQLCVTVSTINTFLNSEFGVASFSIIADSAAEGYAPAAAAMEYLNSVAYWRAVHGLENGYNSSEVKDMFQALGDYEDSADYLYICQVMEDSKYKDFIGEEGIERLVSLMHLPTVPELLVQSNYTAIDYLAGIWLAENTTKGFVMEADGNASYDLPFVDAEGSAYSIIDGVFTLLDDQDNPVGEVYRFTPIDGEHMTIYCYADDQTYSMEKILDN